MKTKLSLLSLILLFYFNNLEAQSQNQTTNQNSVTVGKGRHPSKVVKGSSHSHAFSSVQDDKFPESRYDFNHEIELSPESKSDEIKIQVPKESKSMRLNIQCFTDAGQVQIELFNPAGGKEGYFTVGTEPRPGKKEKATGSMRKNITEPEIGEWTVKIIPNQPKAKVSIRAMFIN